MRWRLVSRPAARRSPPAVAARPGRGHVHPTVRSIAAFIAAATVVIPVVAACGDAGRTQAGVVVALDTVGGAVHGFTLRSTDGTVTQFVIGTLDLEGAAFPAEHLVEHAVTAAPISIAYRVTEGQNVVYRMVDAPWAGATGGVSPSPAGASPGGASPPAPTSSLPSGQGTSP